MFDSGLAVLARHAQALWLVVTVLIPCLIRRRHRPVIFVRYSGIGDIICTIPAVRELKKRHLGAEVIYNCHADSEPVVRMANVADRTLHFRYIGLVNHWYGFLLSGYYQFGYNDESDNADAPGSLISEFADQHGV